MEEKRKKKHREREKKGQRKREKEESGGGTQRGEWCNKQLNKLQLQILEALHMKTKNLKF